MTSSPFVEERFLWITKQTILSIWKLLLIQFRSSQTSTFCHVVFNHVSLHRICERGYKGTVKEDGITIERIVAIEWPLISLPSHTTYLTISPSLPTSAASDYKQQQKNQPSSQLGLVLTKLAGSSDGHRSNVSALIFPLYLPWPDNVNPLMKLLCACPKPLSSRGNFLFSFRHTLPAVMSAPVMATSLCLLSLSPSSFFSVLSLFSILVSFLRSTVAIYASFSPLSLGLSF